MMKFHFTMHDDPGGESAVSEQDLAYAGAGAMRRVPSSVAAARASSTRWIMATSRVSSCGYYRSTAGNGRRDTGIDVEEDTQ